MMLPPKVSLSTMAAQSLGSENVFVHPESTTRSTRSRRRSFPPVRSTPETAAQSLACEFHVIEFVDQQEIHSAVTGDGFGELFLVRGFDELVHQPCREDIFGNRVRRPRRRAR